MNLGSFCETFCEVSVRLNVLTVLIWDVTCSWNACLLTYHLFVCNEQPESPKPVKHQASVFFLMLFKLCRRTDVYSSLCADNVGNFEGTHS